MGMATSKVRLNICGSSYVVNTSESEDYMQNLADRLNLDMNELMASSNSVSITTAAVMTALNYRDELEKASGSADNMRRQIVGNDGICAGLGHGAHRVGQPVQFPGIDQRIEGDMHPYTPGMAEGDGLPQFLRRKVARRAAGIESGKPQINSISAAEHSGAKHFAVARGG